MSYKVGDVVSLYRCEWQIIGKTVDNFWIISDLYGNGDYRISEPELDRVLDRIKITIRINDLQRT